ncbi:MAG: AAA family ATPase, partial [Actinobacteria bacterium]|nr:AAA family ATPase [Actinomycetota bacterium]
MSPGTTTPELLDELVEVTTAMRAGIDTVLAGRSDLVRTALTVLLAQGHLLVEDVPGVGKTTLAKAIARTIAAPVGRVQFTPDLLPSDLTGVNLYR